MKAHNSRGANDTDSFGHHFGLCFGLLELLRNEAFFGGNTARHWRLRELRPEHDNSTVGSHGTQKAPLNWFDFLKQLTTCMLWIVREGLLPLISQCVRCAWLSADLRAL